jgi:hypothetical protein
LPGSFLSPSNKIALLSSVINWSDPVENSLTSLISWYRNTLTTLSRISRPLNAFRKPTFVPIRLRSLSIFSGSHLNLFHTRLIPLLTFPFSDLSSLFLSNIRCSSSRTFSQLLSIASKSLFWSLVSPCCGKATPASRRTIERFFTLSNHNSQ